MIGSCRHGMIADCKISATLTPRIVANLKAQS